MDYIFTQKELSCLDDIMPEIFKKSKEDCKAELEDGKDSNFTENEKVVYYDIIILIKYHIFNNVLKKIDSINISQELTKTHIWQDLVNSNNQLQSEREIPIKKEKSMKKCKKNNDKIPIPIIDEDSLPLMGSNNLNNQKNVDNNLQASNSIPTIVVSTSNTKNGEESVL
jgi:hypothetical protein